MIGGRLGYNADGVERQIKDLRLLREAIDEARSSLEEAKTAQNGEAWSSEPGATHFRAQLVALANRVISAFDEFAGSMDETAQNLQRTSGLTVKTEEDVEDGYTQLGQRFAAMPPHRQTPGDVVPPYRPEEKDLEDYLEDPNAYDPEHQEVQEHVEAVHAATEGRGGTGRRENEEG